MPADMNDEDAALCSGTEGLREEGLSSHDQEQVFICDLVKRLRVKVYCLGCMH